MRKQYENPDLSLFQLQKFLRFLSLLFQKENYKVILRPLRTLNANFNLSKKKIVIFFYNLAKNYTLFLFYLFAFSFFSSLCIFASLFLLLFFSFFYKEAIRNNLSN